MGREKSIVVLDLGTYKTTAIVGEVRDGEVNIIGFGEAYTKGVEKGLIVKSFDVIHSIKEAIDSAENIVGYKIDSVIANIGGYHIVSGNEYEELEFPEAPRNIQREDIDILLENLANDIETEDYEIIHIIPRKYILDDDNEVEDPVGLVGSKLRGEFHLVFSKVNDFVNLKKVIEGAGIRVVDFVANPIASSTSVLYEDEKDLGVAVLDIGAGTTDIAVYIDKGIEYSSAIPLGGNQITMDIAHRFKISKEDAEAIKIDYGSALLAEYENENLNDEVIEVYSIGKDEPIQVNQFELVETIEARLTEIFEIVKVKLEKKNYLKKLKAGIVLTGGVANTQDIKVLAERVLGVDVRIGKPRNYKGFADRLSKPDYATTVGIVLYQKENLVEKEPALFSFSGANIDLMNLIKNLVERFKNLF